MARRSRKGQPNADAPVVSKKYKTAVYVRLSVEDSGKKDDGDSIENQIYIVKEFVSKHDDLMYVATYTDNGQTGTNFERPAFETLMADIKKGKIDCIVVKDLSRFGRNYIETGEYLEKIFPFMGVRFIAITDNYDSLTSDNSTEGLIISLKNLINDAYAKDISRKVCAALEMKQKNGDFIGAFAPYGYKKSSDNKNKLVIDDEVAPIVRRIFNQKSEGLGNNIIARQLNQQQIPCPLVRRIETGEVKTSNKTKIRMWQGQTIKMICNNPIYIGHMVQGKFKEALYEHKKPAKTDKADWIVVENTHEPLIDIETWNMVQDILQERRKEFFDKQGRYAHLGNYDNVFKGLVICAECGTKMIRYKDVSPCGSVSYTYICPNRLQTMGLLCGPKSVNEKVMRELAYSEVQHKIDLSTDLLAMIERIDKQTSNKKEQANISSRIAEIKKEVKKIHALRCSLYESYAEKLLTESEYIFAKNKYEQDSNKLGEELTSLERELAEKSETLSYKNRWLSVFQSFRKEKKVTREMALALINKIVVSDDGKFEIFWKFTDEMNTLALSIKEAV